MPAPSSQLVLFDSAETLTRSVLGMTQEQRVQNLNSQIQRLAPDGWRLKRYNNQGMFDSSAIFVKNPSLKPVPPARDYNMQWGYFTLGQLGFIAVVLIVLAYLES